MEILKLMISKTSVFRRTLTVAVFNGRGVGHLPSLICARILSPAPQCLQIRPDVRKELMAPELDRRSVPCLNKSMHRRFYGFFFYFPRPLAEVIG